jgi:hypothetical protein
MKLLVIGTASIGGRQWDVGAGEAAQDRAYDGSMVQDALLTFDPETIVHTERNTPFEKLLDSICAGNGWANKTVTVKQLPAALNQVDGVIAFVRPNTGDTIKQMARQAEDMGALVVEFTV